MRECTHHWTVTSECPFCLRQEIERLNQIIVAVANNIASSPAKLVDESKKVGEALVRLDKQDAEIERLRGKLATVLAVVKYHRNDYNGVQLDPVIKAVHEALGDE